jgi:hypothetical protein
MHILDNMKRTHVIKPGRPEVHPASVIGSGDLKSAQATGQQFFPTPASEKPYDWANEEDWSEGKPEVRNKIVINSTPPPLGEGHYSPITKSQRCINALSYTGALIGTFVEVLREAYLPEDQLAEIRRLSEEEGISTVIHMEWPPRLRS